MPCRVCADTRTRRGDDMDAKELLRRYAAGERDFHTADLSGAHLHKVDLSGAGLKKAILSVKQI